MTGILSGFAACMLLSAHVALGQPMAASSPSAARATSQESMTQLARPINTAPSAGSAYDPAVRSRRSQGSAALIERAMQAWVVIQPAPPLFPDDGAKYVGSYADSQSHRAGDTAAPDWLSRFDFLFKAGEALQDATSFETSDVFVQLDPLSLRCTFTFRLNGSSSPATAD